MSKVFVCARGCISLFDFILYALGALSEPLMSAPLIDPGVYFRGNHKVMGPVNSLVNRNTRGRNSLCERFCFTLTEISAAVFPARKRANKHVTPPSEHNQI
jgi:hypothetical protein